MTTRSSSNARPSLTVSRVPLVSALLAGFVAVGVSGCIPPAGRTESSAPGGPASPSPTAVPTPTGPTPIPSYVRPTPTPLPTFLVYVVKAGDNLNTIAHRFGTKARSIAFWNRGTYPSLDPEDPNYKPNLVRVGWTLVLIPNTVVDEQTLPDPTPNPTDPSEADPEPSPSV